MIGLGDAASLALSKFAPIALPPPPRLDVRVYADRGLPTLEAGRGTLAALTVVRGLPTVDGGSGTRPAV